ncbi:MAG: hypothetical protein ACI9N1_002091 [Flavobacteriales bacterium]|jgi:hypothetical protein
MFRNLWSIKLLVIGVFFSLSSCKKDKLKDGKEVLIGEYEWIYSARRSQFSSVTYSDTIDPISESTSFKMEFQEKGKIIFYENDEIIKERRIVFTSWMSPGSNGHTFDINLNNKKEENFTGSININGLSGNGDTIAMFDYFPYADDERCPIGAGSCNLTHYFVKR